MIPEAVAELLRAMFGGTYLILTALGIYYLVRSIWVVFRK